MVKINIKAYKNKRQRIIPNPRGVKVTLDQVYGVIDADKVVLVEAKISCLKTLEIHDWKNIGESEVFNENAFIQINTEDLEVFEQGSNMLAISFPDYPEHNIARATLWGYREGTKNQYYALWVCLVKK